MILPNSLKDKLIGDMAHMICNVLDFFNRYDIYLETLDYEQRKSSHEKKLPVKAEKLLKIAQVQYDKAMGRLKKVEKGLTEWGKKKA